MWHRYSYEISTAHESGEWRSALNDDATFSRNPEISARALLEQWINSHHGKLRGGRVFTYSMHGTNLLQDPGDIVATVRVRVWSGDPGGEPAAAAYLGHPREDTKRASRFSLRRVVPRPRRRDGAGTGKAEVVGTLDDDGTGETLVPG